MSLWDLGCIVWLTGGAGGLCFLMKVRSSRKEGVQQLGPQRTRRIKSSRTQGPAPLSSFHWIFSLKTRISGQTLGNLKSQACICNRESQCWTALCHPLCKPTHSYSRPLSHLLQGQRKDLTWEGSKLIPRECLIYCMFLTFSTFPFCVRNKYHKRVANNYIILLR